MHWFSVSQCCRVCQPAWMAISWVHRGTEGRGKSHHCCHVTAELDHCQRNALKIRRSIKNWDLGWTVCPKIASKSQKYKKKNIRIKKEGCINIIPGDQQWTQLQVHIRRDTSPGIVMMAMFDLIWSQQILIFYSVICGTFFILIFL